MTVPILLTFLNEDAIKTTDALYSGTRRIVFENSRRIIRGNSYFRGSTVSTSKFKIQVVYFYENGEKKFDSREREGEKKRIIDEVNRLCRALASILDSMIKRVVE